MPRPKKSQTTEGHLNTFVFIQGHSGFPSKQTQGFYLEEEEVSGLTTQLPEGTEASSGAHTSSQWLACDQL